MATLASSNILKAKYYVAGMAAGIVQAMNAQIINDSAGLVAPVELEDGTELRSPRLVMKSDSQLPEGVDWGTAKREIDL